MTEAEPTRLQRWAYGGIELTVDDKGEITLADLKGFIAGVEELNEGRSEPTKITLHRWSLRAMRIEGSGGPHLDWRDDD